MKPYVIIHNGVSADGRMDWGAGDEGLYYELAAGFQADAMLSGSNTMITAFKDAPDDPLAPDLEEMAFSTPGMAGEVNLQRLVVVDSGGRIRKWNTIKSQPWWRDPVCLVAGWTPKKYIDYLNVREVPFIQTGEEKVDLGKALEELNQRYAIQRIRVDSGGLLNGALLRAGLVDEISLLVNPELVGGTSARSVYVAPDLESATGVLKLKLLHSRRLRKGVVWLRYTVLR